MNKDTIDLIKTPRLRKMPFVPPITLNEDDRKYMLAMAIEKSAHPFMIGHIKGQILLFNPAFCKLTGYTEEELLSVNWSTELTPPEWVKVTLAAAEKTARTGKPTLYEKEYLRKDGSRVPVEVFMHLFFNEGLQLEYYYAFITDISERKAAEAALKKSEEKFSKAFRNNPDPFCITALNDGRFVEINESFQRFTGYTTEEVIGKTSNQLGFWVLSEQRQKFIDCLRNNIDIRGLETDLCIKSGEVKTTLISMEIIDVGGESCILSIIKDITDRKIVEEALRVSEECFSKAFKASPFMVCISYLEDGRFIDVNDSFCTALEFSREEVLGLTSDDINIWYTPADRKEVVSLIKAHGSVRDKEYHFRKKSGEIRFGSYSGEAITIDGQPCLLSILFDITDRRRMESEMTRIDRLEMVGRMAAVIGHEIRNPMTTVRGFLQLLKARDKYEEETDVFNLMIEELDRANAIITEFLSLTKDKMVQLDLKNLNSIVSNLFPLLQAQAMEQDKNIVVRLEKVPDLLLDEKEIRQLMLNLVSNGLEAMEPGGTLTIHTFMKAYNPVLSIQDQGHGMDDEVVGKLGTPFFTTKNEGTGLGIAVCYGIIERHKARIDITTSPAGTCFNIIFPY